MKAKLNSDFVAGKTNLGYEIPLEKELIHYESLGAEEKGNNDNIIRDNKNEKLPSRDVHEFICEMCMERFNESNKLQRHRIQWTPTAKRTYENTSHIISIIRRKVGL